jgi:CheY-like chemotaxis protein/anti-sigma regulatory factor (Ser/Thr protein kinase)
MKRKYGLEVRLVVRKKIGQLAEEVTLLLFQALRELLFNVVKHAGVKSSTVQVNERDGRIEVTVKDNGHGFDPSSLRAEGGHSQGIGLFGIRERLTYFGGSMEIASTPGKGSRFKMILPQSIILAKSKPAVDVQKRVVDNTESPDRSRPADGKKKFRILLADDHIVMRQGLSRLLRGEPDMEIVGEASDGESAIEMIRELLPEVVLMDINMPGMGGIEAVRIIHKEFPDIHIVGLSMFQEAERADAMRKAGAVDYIAKSGPSANVITAIRNCMNNPDSTGMLL